LKVIDAWAFARTNFVGEVEIPEGVTAVYAGAFEDCNNLSWIVVPETVTYIETTVADNPPFGDNLVLVVPDSYAHTWCIENDHPYELYIP
jgi:hypothetical protein